MVKVAVVGRGEDGDHGWELLVGRLAMHGVAVVLDLVSAQDAEEVVPLEERAGGVVAVRI